MKSSKEKKFFVIVNKIKTLSLILYAFYQWRVTDSSE